MRREPVLGWGLAAATVVALLSIGGAAVFGAPLLLPALWVAVRRSAGWARRGFIILASLVAAEVAWAAVYVTGGEDGPFIWFAPVAAALLVGVGLAESGPPAPAEA